MAQVKLTKNELRLQQYKLGQLQKYLPTLQMKKAMLQLEVNHVETEIEKLQDAAKEKKRKIETFQQLFSDRGLSPFFECLHVEEVQKTYENIAGIEIPLFERVIFSDSHYFLYQTPFWWDSALDMVRDLLVSEQQIAVAEEKKAILEKELRDVSIRVNLFEKILIPRTEANIKKIRIFLGDQQLAAVSQAKVAKAKIESRKHTYRKKEELCI